METVVLNAGKTELRVEADEKAMGERSAEFAAGQLKRAAAAGRRPVLWLMAAPSGFAFYKAFAGLAAADKALAEICRRASWFQFDDYPVARGDRRFPITFRHLLESYFFKPLAAACGPLADVNLLEIGGADDERVMAAYAEKLEAAAADPRNFLVQLKGTGMDGHWGFHGHETPLDAPPAVMRVAMNKANIHQQMLDWPEYFKREADVPPYACTCNVALFLKAHLIVDNVPQPSKLFSMLAVYGNDKISNDAPSSALKGHPNSHAWLTRASAGALLDYRALTDKNPGAKLTPAIRARLEAIWKSDDAAAMRANVEAMNGVLKKLGMI